MPEYIEKKFAASTIEVNYAEGPDNGPPMLLIHGLSSHWPAWESVIDQFAADWHVFAIDLRGHGDSGRTPGEYTFKHYPTEVVEFLAEVIKEPAYIIGHSLGAVTAVGVSAAVPELVAAAVLEDPPLYTRDWFDESMFAPSFQAALDIRNKNLSVKDTAIEFKKIDDQSSDEAIVMRSIAVTKTDPEVWAVVIEGRSAKDGEADELLQAAKPPILLMQANPDMGGAMRDVEATRTVDLLEHGRHVKWDDVGHGMHDGYPERFVELANAFFKQVLRKRG